MRISSLSIVAETNAVVETLALFVPSVGVGAVGVPVKEGLEIVAYGLKSTVPQETEDPLVVKNLPLFPVCGGKMLSASVIVEDIDIQLVPSQT